MKTTFQFGSPCQLTAMLLLLYCLTVSGGRAADSVGAPPENSAAELSEARLSLAEARKTGSDPRTAVGHYLDAADAVVRSLGVSSRNETSEEARSIYNAASQEVTVLLRSSAELWNRTETIPSRDGIYRLRFAAGSHEEGTWIQVTSTSFVPQSKYMKRSRTKRRGLTIGVGCWWESTSQLTPGSTFFRCQAWLFR